MENMVVDVFVCAFHFNKKKLGTSRFGGSQKEFKRNVTSTLNGGVKHLKDVPLYIKQIDPSHSVRCRHRRHCYRSNTILYAQGHQQTQAAGQAKNHVHKVLCYGIR